jgi:hypothetical protein
MQKIKIMFKAALVITVVLALVLPSSAIITYNSHEKNYPTMNLTEIKEKIQIGGPINVQRQKMPLTMIENGKNTASRGTDVLVSPYQDFQGNPALAADDRGVMLTCYEFEEDVTESNIFMAVSRDNGQTWTDEGYWAVDGTFDELSSLDYAGFVNEGYRFHGTFLSSDNDYGDGYQIEITDIDDPANWGLWTTSWSDNGFFDFTSCDMAAHGNAIGASTDYFVMSLVGSFVDIPGYPNCTQVPFYQISVDDSSWIYWFYYNYSSNGRMDIDRTAEIIYYAFEWDNNGNQDVILLSSELQYVGEVEPAGWGDGMGEGRKYQVEGSANTIHPSISAEGDYVYLVLETDVVGDQDVVCYYSHDGGETYQMSDIAVSSSDETNPKVYATGEDAFCVFTKDGNLYSAITHDGGETWEISEDAINDEPGTVIEQYKCADIFGTRTVWTDDRSDDGDVFFDLIDIGDPPTTPTIDGPTEIKPNTETDYTFTTTDPDGDQVYYYIEWGDGTTQDWQGPFASGTPYTASHSWSGEQLYTIKCKAKDSNGLESGFGTLDISTPRNYGLLFRLMEYIQHMFPNILGKLGL